MERLDVLELHILQYKRSVGANKSLRRASWPHSRCNKTPSAVRSRYIGKKICNIENIMSIDMDFTIYQAEIYGKSQSQEDSNTEECESPPPETVSVVLPITSHRDTSSRTCSHAQTLRVSTLNHQLIRVHSQFVRFFSRYILGRCYTFSPRSAVTSRVRQSNAQWINPRSPRANNRTDSSLSMTLAMAVTMVRVYLYIFTTRMLMITVSRRERSGMKR